MYLVAQIWWLLLLAFFLGVFLGYLVWRACGLPWVKTERDIDRRGFEERIAALEKDNARLEKAAHDAEALARRAPLNGTPSGADAKSAPTTPPAPPEPVLEITRIGFLDQPRDGKADNLKLIRGIGPRLEKVLNTIGVFHFEQIAGWNEGDLAFIDSKLGDFAGRAVRDKWIEQSRKLVARARAASAADGGNGATRD